MMHNHLIRLFVLLGLFYIPSLSAPTFKALSKRDSALYGLWQNTPGGHKAGGDSATYFNVDQGMADTWGITYLYGCAAIMIADNKNVVVGHLQQISGNGCISLDDQTSVNNYINKLQQASALYVPQGGSKAIVIYPTGQQSSTGVKAIKTCITDYIGLDANQILEKDYSASSGTGEPDPQSPAGLAVIQWTPNTSGGGVVNFYFNQEAAISSVPF